MTPVTAAPPVLLLTPFLWLPCCCINQCSGKFACQEQLEIHTVPVGYAQALTTSAKTSAGFAFARRSIVGNV
jgi:hypothetical protein